MDKVVFNEVYDILNCIDIKYRRNIPNSLMNFIKSNKNLFYETNIKELPENLNGVKYETKVFLGIIYKKYFMNTDLDISNIEKERIQNSLKNNNSIQSNKNINLSDTRENNVNLIDITRNNFLRGIINKIKNFFKR